jgi:cytochrome P450
MPRRLERLFRTCFGSRIQQFEGIPGPTPSFPFGTLREFSEAELKGKCPWDVFAGYEKKYGGITLIWYGFTPIVVLNDAELIKEVLVTKHKDYYKDDPVTAFKPVLESTEFDVNGPEWERLRRSEPISMKGFDEWLPTQSSVVKKVVDTHLARLTKSNEHVDLLPTMERMVYDTYNECIVGQQLDDKAYQCFYTTSNMATKRMQLPKWVLVPPLDPRFWYARSYHFGAFEKIVAETKRHLYADAKDLLHKYLRNAPDVSDKQVATFLGNIHAGGVFPAATALVNTMYLLNRHPEVAAKLYSELSAADSDGYVSKQCTFLDCVLRESMRFLPPVPMFFRNVLKTQSTQLGKYVLPANTKVNVVIQGVHRSSRYWKEPDRFDPSRWESMPLSAVALDSDHYFPFGRGPRLCVGAALATYCMKVMLASILSRVRVAIDSHLPYRQFNHCGVAEPKGIKGRFVPHQ